MLHRLPLLAIVALGLSGCVISSPEQLIDPAEAITPLPDSFTMYPYAERDGGYALSSDAPVVYTRDGTDYFAGDDSLILRFADLPGHESHVISVQGNQANTLYGTLEVLGDILRIRIMLSEIGPDALRDLPAEISGAIHAEDGGLIVSSRPALDLVMARLAEGQLVSSPLVAWISTNPDASPPATLLIEGDTIVPAP